MSGRRLKAERRKAFGRVGEPQTPEQAENLRNDYAVRAEREASNRLLVFRENDVLELREDPRPLRIGSADVTFTAPPGGMPTVELGSFFGIDAGGITNLWSGNGVAWEAPGPVTPLPRPGTKARAVRLRGMVGVLQDQWHMAGVWPWLDGQRFIDRPWVLTMEGLAASIERMSREGAVQRYPPLRVTAINTDRREITVTSEPRWPWPLRAEPEPPKRGRVPAFIPTRRLDGRR